MPEDVKTQEPQVPEEELEPEPALGVMRLDYDYPPAPGDIDCPESYDYKVFYRAVPGLTFEACQTWPDFCEKKPAEAEDVKKEIREAVRYLLEEKKVRAITGDCGFMMWLQQFVRNECRTPVPILMSALCQLPTVLSMYGRKEEVIIMTANGETLTPMSGLIAEECGVDLSEDRFHIVGCQDVKGFEAVAKGDKVDVKMVTPGIVAKAREALLAAPHARAFLLECTELPPYADALRFATGLPVYDSITGCNACMSGVRDNPRFGLNDWQKAFDAKQEKYVFGQNLSAAKRAKLVTKVPASKALPEDEPAAKRQCVGA